MSENTMRIWDAVAETDPAFTKKVDYGAHKYTAIGAYSRIKAATKLWGPVGTAWGWRNVVFQMFGDGEKMAIDCEINLFYPGATEGVTAHGAAPVYLKGKLDDEVHKKALTDAITKALSYLGFSADVFLGCFDDDKYVAEMNAKYGNGKNNGNGAQKPADAPADPRTERLAGALKAIYSPEMFNDSQRKGKWHAYLRTKYGERGASGNEFNEALAHMEAVGAAVETLRKLVRQVNAPDMPSKAVEAALITFIAEQLNKTGRTSLIDGDPAELDVWAESLRAKYATSGQQEEVDF